MIYILDTETNGLTLYDIEITQLAYLKLDENLEILDEFNKYYYVSNLKDSPDITGLDHATLATLSSGHKLTADEFSDTLEEIKHGVIIGQNINYDIMVLDATSIRYNLPITPKYPLEIINQFSPEDTLMNLKWISEHHMTQEGKDLLKERFKEKETFHNALYDVYTVYALIKFNKEFRARFKNYMKYVPRRD